MAAGKHGKHQPDQRRLLGRCWEIMPSTLHPASGGALETKQRSWGSVSSIQFRIISEELGLCQQHPVQNHLQISGACLCAKLLPLCVTLCDHMDCSSLGSSVCGITSQEYWSGLPCPPPGDLPNPGIEPTSLMAPVLAGGFFTASDTWESCRFLGFTSNPL